MMIQTILNDRNYNIRLAEKKSSYIDILDAHEVTQQILRCKTANKRNLTCHLDHIYIRRRLFQYRIHHKMPL